MNVRWDILAWLLVPIVGTLLALLVVRWRARPRGPVDPHEGMNELSRFRAAMNRPLPASGATAATPTAAVEAATPSPERPDQGVA